MKHQAGSREPLVLLESFDPRRGGWGFVFEEPEELVIARRIPDVLPALARVEAATREGRHAAGFLAYECAPAFEPAMRTRPPVSFPLVWFGVFGKRRRIRPGEYAASGTCRLSEWTPSISREAYLAAFRRIQRHITAGDTYQVNFTFRLRAGWEGEPFALYRRLCRSQRSAYSAYIAWEGHRILSVSPELFFGLSGGILTARPMKGTRPRGRWAEEDDALAEELANSSKDRSENVMIVDLLRNDMGRISETGTVRVERLFEVERYETVFQMTSTIRSRVRPGSGVADLFAALFPSGSVTGAPKIRTMEIIAETEESPRGVYTGSIGYVSPGPEAVFNVAIRTLRLETGTGEAELGVGGGITHSSRPEEEYDECFAKARFVSAERPEFELLETMLWDGREYGLLDRHLARLERSARYFDFRFDPAAVRRALDDLARTMGPAGHRVRLLLAADGSLRLEPAGLRSPAPERPFRVALAREPVDSGDPFLYHKTTHRLIYERAAKSRPDCDAVILQNERGEITEADMANVVVETEDGWRTPPVECGLLPGVYRAELLDAGKVREGVLCAEDLARAKGLYLANAVRRLWRVQLVD